MIRARTIGFALIIVLPTFGGLTPAHAGSTHIRLHQSDFYARASEGLSAPHAASGEKAQGGGCYVTLSATEASRGIRYWTGNCGAGL